MTRPAPARPAVWAYSQDFSAAARSWALSGHPALAMLPPIAAGDQRGVARIAEACGIKGIRVEKASEVDEALQTAFRTDGPVLVDVVVAKEELAIPPQIKLEQAKGFSLYMLRAIISGRGDEVIELAKTNWLR